MSHKTNDAEKKLTSYELEVLAIVTASKKFRVHLLGLKFKVATDCAAFTMTMNKKELTPKIARWAIILDEFDYAIEHRKGNKMKHCDALSRYPVTVAVRNEFIAILSEAQKEDEKLKTLMKILEESPYEDYFKEATPYLDKKMENDY